jgi:uncharacterized membrane-anchored protein YitT (DUF2179 family)
MSYVQKAGMLGVAAALQGASMALFLFPHFIPSGGAASVGVLLKFLMDIPYAVTLWGLNAGLLLAAMKWLGKSSVLWTLYCVSVTSVVIELISSAGFSPISHIFTDMIMGSIIFGVGIGILFKMGASSGGMDILALILSKLKGYSPGKCLFLINGSLLLLTGLVVDWKVIIFALICQYIGTRILDLIVVLKVNIPKKAVL